MSTTIAQALQNANYHLQAPLAKINIELAKQQLNDAVILLGKGYELGEFIEPILEEYGSADKTPKRVEEEVPISEIYSLAKRYFHSGDMGAAGLLSLVRGLILLKKEQKDITVRALELFIKALKQGGYYGGEEEGFVFTDLGNN